MSNEISMFEKLGGTYTEVDGILYPNISGEVQVPGMDCDMATTNIGKRCKLRCG